MPFTPFHMGPGLLMKGGVARMSLGAFAAAQIAIDLEPGYRLVTDTYPIHGWTHSLAGASAVGVAAGLASLPALRSVNRLLASGRGLAGLFPPPGARAAALGGLLGGVSHVLLDMLVHPDVQPLWPFSRRVLVGVMSDGAMSWACLAAGLAGAAIVVLRRPWVRGPRSRLAP